MAYLQNGANVIDACELATFTDNATYKSYYDMRYQGSFPSNKLLFSGLPFKQRNSWQETVEGNSVTVYRNTVAHYLGYVYSNDALAGKYLATGLVMHANARGYRPQLKERYTKTTPGYMYINRFSDNEVWVSSSIYSRSGIKICTPPDKMAYVFAVCMGGGGGGGSSNSGTSGGGGGSGGYIYGCMPLKIRTSYSTSYYTIINCGGGGAGGVNAADGGNGGSSYYMDYDGNSSACKNSVSAYGGGGGKGGNNGGVGGAGGQCTTFDSPFVTSEMALLQRGHGVPGGNHDSGGGSVGGFYTSYYTPESFTRYMLEGTGGGAGLGGGGGGGYGGGSGGKGGAAFENGYSGGSSAGGGGGAYVWLSTRTGGNGGDGYVSICY